MANCGRKQKDCGKGSPFFFKHAGATEDYSRGGQEALSISGVPTKKHDQNPARNTDQVRQLLWVFDQESETLLFDLASMVAIVRRRSP